MFYNTILMHSSNSCRGHKIQKIFLITILSLSIIGNIFSVSWSSSSSTFTFLSNALAFEDNGNENRDYNYYYSTSSIPTAGNGNQQVIDCSNNNLNVNGVESNIDAFSADANNNNLQEETSDFIQAENTDSDDNDNNNAIFLNKNLVNVCANLNLNGQPVMMQQADHVYVVWEDNSNGGDADIFFRASDDNGQTFGPVIDLSNNAGVSINPRMLVSGNNVYVAWQDNSKGGNNEVFFRASNDNGQTFNPVINLSNTRGESSIPTMLVSGNHLYIAWSDEENSNDEFTVLFRASNDNGVTFNPVIDLSPSHDISGGFRMLVSGNNVYVVMADLGAPADILDVYFRASNNNGQTFNPVINLSNNAGSSDNPRMLVSGNNVYVAWIDRTNGGDADIFFRASNDNGLTFGPFIDLSNNAGASSNQQIIVSGNNVYVVWIDTTNGGDTDIFIRASNDNGQTFGPFVDLSNNAGASSDIQILVSGNSVYILWIDNSNGGEPDILFRASNNNGQTFNPLINISNTTGESRNPQMLVSVNDVYVAWEDAGNDPGDEFDVFFRASNDNGQTSNPAIKLSSGGDTGGFSMLVSGNNVYVVFVDLGAITDDIFIRASNDNGQTFEPLINLSNNDGLSFNPRMLVSGNNVYVVWEDTSNGDDPDIFFRASNNNGQTFNPVIDLSDNDGDSRFPIMLVG